MSDWMKWGNDMASYAKNAAQQATTLVAGTDLEKKLSDATTNEPWGASSAPATQPSPGRVATGARSPGPAPRPGTMLSEIARATYGYDDFRTVELRCT